MPAASRQLPGGAHARGAPASLQLRGADGAVYDATSSASRARLPAEMVRVLVAGMRA